MRYVLIATLSLSLAGMVLAELPGQAPKEGFSLPPGMTPIQKALYTQSIYVLNGRPTIEGVRRTRLERKWQVNGGLEAIASTQFKSTVYRNEAASKVKVWIGGIPVKNSFGYFQTDRGFKREYPDGSIFLDVLESNGTVFEVRKLEKAAGKWKPQVMYSEPKARPKGYDGLKKACMDCHGGANGPGTGEYGVGLAPGGDSIISDPFPELENAREEFRNEEQEATPQHSLRPMMPAMRGRACST